MLAARSATQLLAAVRHKATHCRSVMAHPVLANPADGEDGVERAVIPADDQVIDLAVRLVLVVDDIAANDLRRAIAGGEFLDGYGRDGLRRPLRMDGRGDRSERNGGRRNSER